MIIDDHSRIFMHNSRARWKVSGGFSRINIPRFMNSKKEEVTENVTRANLHDFCPSSDFLIATSDCSRFMTPAAKAFEQQDERAHTSIGTQIHRHPSFMDRDGQTWYQTARPFWCNDRQLRHGLCGIRYFTNPLEAWTWLLIEGWPVVGMHTELV